MRRMLVPLLTLFVLCGCLPVSSRVPVGTGVGFKPDPVLLGTWKARDSDGDELSYIHILGNADGSMTALLVTPPHKQSLGEWSAYTLRAATLGANHIVNAQESMSDGKTSSGPLSEQHVLLLYRETGRGKLVLYQMEDNATAAAIRAGEIAGEIEPGQDGDVRITASEPTLDRFFASGRAAKLFSKPLVTLARVE